MLALKLCAHGRHVFRGLHAHLDDFFIYVLIHVFMCVIILILGVLLFDLICILIISIIPHSFNIRCLVRSCSLFIVVSNRITFLVIKC